MVEIVCRDVLEAGELIRTCEKRSSCWDCVLNDICSAGNEDAGAPRRIETVIRIAENGLVKRGEHEEQAEEKSTVAKLRQAERDKREHSFA